MPAERDLITESRAMIASWEASLAVHDSLRHAEWAVRVVPLVLNVLEVRIGELDALRARVAKLEQRVREEGNAAGRLQDLLRAACADGADARARGVELGASAAWFAAEAAWLKKCIAQAVAITDNEQLHKHDPGALIECDLINYSLAPHRYFAPVDWDERLRGLEVDLSDAAIAGIRDMLWGMEEGNND